MLICFELNRTELIEYRNATDGRTDRIAVSISRVSVLTRDKNEIRRIHVAGQKRKKAHRYDLLLITHPSVSSAV